VLHSTVLIVLTFQIHLLRGFQVADQDRLWSIQGATLKLPLAHLEFLLGMAYQLSWDLGWRVG
jgi:hypothetical protein